jgi:hypothetical protein
MAPKFKTKRGLCTLYALACGYLDQYENGEHRVTLWHEGPTIHVRYHVFNGPNAGRQFWESFPTNQLRKARKLWAATKRLIQATVQVQQLKPT